MLTKLRRRLGREEGFTLIELLVVMLIIGILAAVALPVFLGQQDKAEDAEAKSNARNLVSHVESCFSTERDYTKCNDKTELEPSGGRKTGLNIASTTSPAATEVAVASATSTTYKVTAQSKDSRTFSIERDGAGVMTRSCSAAGKGACPSNQSW